MKLSIISKNPEAPHVLELIQAARRGRIRAEVVDFENLEALRKQANKLGDVIYWRASSLGIKSERASAAYLLRDKYVINRAIFNHPYVTHKFYQQAAVRAAGQVDTIPTYKYGNKAQLNAAIKNNVLKFPFIAKPDLGARGVSVQLVEGPADLAALRGIREFVFQNFIKNNGDWRVLVLGGQILGVIKRTAKAGTILNNVFQGAKAVQERDESIISEVAKIAENAAAALGLVFCGIDIIRDEGTGIYHFLEANTAPEWLEGFQAATKVNVADKFIDFCIAINDRHHKPLPELVTAYYEQGLRGVGIKPEDFFHFASRLYLWSGGKKAQKLVNEVRPHYLGKDKKSIKRKLEVCLEEEMRSLIPERQKYLDEYKKLRNYNRILFKVLFSETVYKSDIREVVKSLKIDKAMIDMAVQLSQDRRAIQLLSTHAVNLFFLLRNYLPESAKMLDPQVFEPDFYLKLAGDRRVNLPLNLKIYLLTHPIIGESLFYKNPVPNPAYVNLVVALEKLIKEGYVSISIDNKLEFLICAAICDYKSSLEEVIKSEAEASLSQTGNFIVDTYNRSADRRLRKDRLTQSEHRSVLYLMSTMPYHNDQPRKNGQTALEEKQPKRVIGRKLIVDFPELRLNTVPAKIDTGAYRGTLHCTDVKLVNKSGVKQLSFVPLDLKHPNFSHQPVIFNEFSITNVKQTNGERQRRYVIKTPIVIEGKKHQIEISLSDRTDMRSPVLIGRRFLRGKFIVDVDV